MPRNNMAYAAELPTKPAPTIPTFISKRIDRGVNAENGYRIEVRHFGEEDQIKSSGAFAKREYGKWRDERTSMVIGLTVKKRAGDPGTPMICKPVFPG